MTSDDRQRDSGRGTESHEAAEVYSGLVDNGFGPKDPNGRARFVDALCSR